MSETEFLKDKHTAFIVKVGNDRDSIEYVLFSNYYLGSL